MFELEDLVSLVRNYNPRTDAGLIEKAYNFGQRMHEGQKRRSGEPYFSHPVEVAVILSQQSLDDATIVTALLHDVVEDTRATYAEIAAMFGREVAELVDGVTKLTNIQLSSTEHKQAENFRKLFIAMSKDLRVILVKLADRLHNMRTIRSMPHEKQVQKAHETMEIFAPLAGRMGMQSMREELEDLSFQVLNPDARRSIIRRFISLQTRKRRHRSPRSPTTSGSSWTAWGSRPTSSAGPSGPMRSGARCRRRTRASRACRTSTGSASSPATRTTATACWGPSISAGRACRGGSRTTSASRNQTATGRSTPPCRAATASVSRCRSAPAQMHEVAESGVAAHWSYRDGVRAENPFAVDPARWLESLNERFDSETDEDHEDFLEAVKLEMYQDQVFCFTPKGEVVKLPRGATPLDYAYAIHTRIGHSCAGAKVDGIRVPLWTRLKNGQSVEIITAEGQTPQATWVDIVATGRAKAAIRQSLREENRERFIKLGRELARLAFDRIGKQGDRQGAGHRRPAAGPADGRRAAGADRQRRDDDRRGDRPALPRADRRPSIASMPGSAVVGLPAETGFSRAHCCQPVPGERIVGITYRGQGVVIHAIDCPALAEFEDQPNRWVDLRWALGKHAPIHTVSLEVTIANDAGVLGRICTLIGEQKANISDLRFMDRKPDFYRLMVDVELRDAQHLHAVMLALEADSDVASVERTAIRPAARGRAATGAAVEGSERVRIVVFKRRDPPSDLTRMRR